MKAILAAAALAAAVFGCSGELTDNASTVDLVLSVDPVVELIDLQPGAANCGTISTINIEVRPKTPSTPTGPLQDVRLTTYRTTWIRRDTGRVTPPPQTRPLTLIVGTGTTNSDYFFHLADFGTIYNQAPFASLQPQNGGRDVETGDNRIRFLLVFELFGETLAGERVHGSASFPLDFCYACGGCQR